MKTKNIFTALCASTWLALGMTSCSNEDTMPAVSNEKEWHTCNLILEGGIEKFDGQTRTAGWENNDTIFLLFDAPDGSKIEGKAFYNAATATWGLSHYGALPEATSTCKAIHLKNGVLPNRGETVVSLGHNCAVYADTTATYCKEGNDVKVKAHIKPITGRIRFRGTPGTKFSLQGIPRYITYTPAEAELQLGFADDSLYVGEDGYTAYFYGADNQKKNDLWVSYSDVAYISSVGGSTLFPGKSSVADVPSVQNPGGWRRTEDKIFTIKGEKFVMIYVKGGTFTMGATFEQESDAHDSERPAHEVTLSDFYIGETEVTEALYATLSGGNISNFPKNEVTWTEALSFTKGLAQITGKNFTLPTEAQWEYAARGGQKSYSYKYSGSSNVDEVAWYRSNSGYRRNAVATKKPNELGIYDMSGNVYEWCSDWFGVYEDSIQTDPIGPASGNSNNERVIRGGDNTVTEKSCRVSFRASDAYNNCRSYIGIRLAISPQ